MATKNELPLRDALRLIAPGPVTLVSTMYHDHPNLMTASWLQPLSLNPTLIAVAVQPSRLTHEFMTKTGVFGVNIPTIDLLSRVHLCGFRSGREGDKFEAAHLTPAEAVAIEAPLVTECVAHIECEVLDRFTIGDHDLFAGNVLRVTASDEAFTSVWNVAEAAGQLLHHLGADRYAGLSRAYTAALPNDHD